MMVLRVATALFLALVMPVSPVTAQQIESGYVRVGDDRLYYEEAGSGEAVVRLHGGLIHSAGMTAQLESLSKDHRVISYDRRGYGRSDMPSERYSPLADLEAVLDSLHVERAVLLGAAAGAAGAIDFTLAHPGRVSGLILVGPIVHGYGFSEHFQWISRTEVRTGPVVGRHPIAGGPGHQRSERRLESSKHEPLAR